MLRNLKGTHSKLHALRWENSVPRVRLVFVLYRGHFALSKSSPEFALSLSFLYFARVSKRAKKIVLSAANCTLGHPGNELVEFSTLCRLLLFTINLSGVQTRWFVVFLCRHPGMWQAKIMSCTKY